MVISKGRVTDKHKCACLQVNRDGHVEEVSQPLSRRYFFDLKMLSAFYILCIQTRFCHRDKHYEGAQWLSGRVLDSRPRGREFESHLRHWVVSLSKNINPSLVLVKPRKTHPFITERLFM